MTSTLSTLEIKKQRPQSLGVCLDLFNTILLLREKYTKGGHYERLLIKNRAEDVKKRYRKEVGQYKIYCKQGLDEFGKEVVNCLF